MVWVINKKRTAGCAFNNEKELVAWEFVVAFLFAQCVLVCTIFHFSACFLFRFAILFACFPFDFAVFLSGRQDAWFFHFFGGKFRSWCMFFIQWQFGIWIGNRYKFRFRSNGGGRFCGIRCRFWMI